MKNDQQKGEHLTLEERIEIYRLTRQGLSNRKIATQLNRHRSTIDRELSRNSHPFTSEYSPSRAQDKATLRAKQQREKAPLKNPAVFLYVRGKLRLHWSPERIAGRLPIDMVGSDISYETIYQYIYTIGRKDQLWRYLRQFHKKRKHKKQLASISPHIHNKVSIEERPTRANKRAQMGHWETDLMESGRTSNACLSAHIERKTRFTKLEKVGNKKANTKQKGLQKTFKLLQSVSKARRPIVRSITYDNGSENAGHEKTTELLRVDSYFCNPYHSWEKGSVENMISKVRIFIPKGTNLQSVSVEYIQQIENWLNNLPLKCLKWKTPNEAMERESNKYKFRKYRKVLSQSGAFPS